MNRLAFTAAAAALLCGGATTIAAQTERIVCVGDSITKGIGDETGQGGYPARVQTLLTAAGRTVSAENRGIDGENVLELLTRLNTISGTAADTLTIMEGTNDITGTVSVESIADTLSQIASKGRSRGFGKVYLITIPPRGPGVSVPATRAETQRLNWEIRDRAVRGGFGPIEVFEVLLDTPNLYSSFYVDNFHMNGKGYDVVADVVADFLLGRDQVPPAPSFIIPANNSTGVSSGTILEVTLHDGQSGVDVPACDLTLNGIRLGAVPTGSANAATLRFQSGGLGGTLLLGIVSIDSAGNKQEKAVAQFTVARTSVLAGDLDFNGRVDGADLVRFARQFGLRSTDAGYERGADIDLNGIIDGSDLARLATNFGLTSL